MTGRDAFAPFHSKRLISGMIDRFFFSFVDIRSPFTMLLLLKGRNETLGTICDSLEPLSRLTTAAVKTWIPT